MHQPQQYQRKPAHKRSNPNADTRIKGVRGNQTAQKVVPGKVYGTWYRLALLLPILTLLVQGYREHSGKHPPPQQRYSEPILSKKMP